MPVLNKMKHLNRQGTPAVSKRYCLGLIIGLVWGLTACGPTTINYQGHRIFNPDYLWYLESEKRDKWQKPEEVLKALEISTSAVIADIGAGGGYFAEKFSKYLDPSGYVYATDVQDVMIEKLQQRVAQRGLINVEVIRGEFDDPMLPDACCDLVFFSSVYKEINGRTDYMKKIKKALKPGGRVAIIEFRPDNLTAGPPLDMRLYPEQVIQELSPAGFTLVKSYDFLPKEYFLIFKPTERN
jgi:ubiquinone/menaquinone biosynthesis C-methylase UbiE